MDKDSKELKFTFTLEEINLILKALSEKPFCEVFAVITKINSQAKEQIEEKDIKK